ncbi:MAG: efflux transporter outer membrane subunit [Burkholderiaceae bacterium]
MKRNFGVVLSAMLLGACAAVPPVNPAGPSAEQIPSQWFAPVQPHAGSVTVLKGWWGRFDDPLLVKWIGLAQAHSPTVSAARSQVYAARAELETSDVLAGPQLAGVASVSRARGASAPDVVATAAAVGAQVSWAVDLWGGNRAGVAQARAQEAAANAGWHEARVLVASELAQRYFSFRLCQVQLRVAQSDRESRAATADAAGHTERVGLTAPAVAALARASLADSAARARQQGDLCDRQLKSLVALTALPEPEVRKALAEAPAVASSAALEAMLAVQAVPMDAIRQRPDVARAQANWVAAAQGVGVAKAAMLPNLSFSGSWLRNRFSTASETSNFNTWSVGPLSMTIPLVGRGALRARADAAEALYESTGQAYAAALRQAVAEVEEALVVLDGLRERERETDAALAGYVQSFNATQARYKVGFASLNELEDARRLQLAADSAVVALRQERINTWINLYVALGGGFDPENPESAIKDPS